MKISAMVAREHAGNSLLCVLKPHKLHRFCIGDQYEKTDWEKNHARDRSCFAQYRTNAVAAQEITMPKVNLAGMTIEALMDLRERVDGMLVERRAAIEQQLERMERLLPWLVAQGPLEAD